MGLKVVLLLGDGHARIGVQEEDTDPVMETVEAGDLDDISQLQPLYVQKSQAELRYEQRRKDQ